MKKTMIGAFALTAILLTACSGGTQTASTESTTSAAAQSSDQTTTAATTEATSGTVEITDIHGTVTVPVNPQKVISLDNRTFETLSDWGIPLVAVPKAVMPADSSYVLDENVGDIGNHREPNLELIAASDPELVIVGQRFASYYEDIKALVPNAAVVDFSFDVSENVDNTGDALVNGLKDTTTSLGKIFEKETEAEKLNADFDAAIERVKAAYNGTDKVMSVVVSGGDIGYSAPKSGRVWGPMYQIFDWVHALDVENATSDHQGDDVSIEAIAQSNPDWIFVLDRDAAVEATATPAKDVIEGSEALKNTNAVMNGHIVYAPNDTYVNESIQTYLEVFGDIATAFENAKQ